VTACQVVCVSIPFRFLKVAAVTDSRAGAVELAFDPSFNVASSIAEVAADSQSWWPLAAVPPRVEGGDGNPEVAGEVLGAEQFIESFHLHIVDRVGVDEITDGCQALLAKGLRRVRHRRCRLSVIDLSAIRNPSVTHL